MTLFEQAQVSFIRYRQERVRSEICIARCTHPRAYVSDPYDGPRGDLRQSLEKLCQDPICEHERRLQRSGTA